MRTRVSLLPGLAWVATLLLWIACGALLLARTLDRDLNHDEHQFVAPAALLVHEGLLPYRDFPLFHLPNIVFAYAAAAKLTANPLLGAKLVCFVSSWLGAGAILWFLLRRLAAHPLTAFGLGAALLSLIVFDPVFLYTAGKTWNHEVPTCLLILAILFHMESCRRNSALFAVLSGLAAGLAVGTRLTFLPALVPLLGAIAWFPLERVRRFRLAVIFSGAVALALAPSIYFLATVPDAFLFGNFEFPRLRFLDPENVRIRKTSTPWRKIRYLVKEVIIPSWPVFLAFFGSLWAARRWRASREPAELGVPLAAAVCAFVVLGCFLPSRYQYQHFFALIPLSVLTVAFAAPRLVHVPAVRRTFTCLLLALAGISSWRAIRAAGEEDRSVFPPLTFLGEREEWFSSRVAATGAEIRAHVPRGRVLTLAPIWPLCGGLDVYPEFATGPFAWRSAQFVDPQRRKSLHLVAPDDLDALLAANPPAGILTIVEAEDLESPLVQWAEDHGYRKVKLRKKRELWVAPSALELTPRPLEPAQ